MGVTVETVKAGNGTVFPKTGMFAMLMGHMERRKSCN
jgi:hypothetical protein